jgi:hypothetical protein
VRVEVESPAPPDQVRRLIDHAERACHAAQSLRHPIPVRLEGRLNGEQL